MHRDVVDVTKDNVNTLVDVTDPDFEPNNVMTVQYNEWTNYIQLKYLYFMDYSFWNIGEIEIYYIYIY